MKSEITAFKDDTLLPLLFDGYIDRAFPDMQFVWKGQKWSSPFHLDGRVSKDGEGAYVSAKWPDRVADKNGSDPIGLVNFWIEKNGGTFWDAIKSLCSICGIEPPQSQEDRQRMEAAMKRREALYKVHKWSQEDLFSEDGKETLSYLMEERGYTEDLIKAMELGFLSKRVEEELLRLKMIGNTGGTGNSPYKLLIAYTANGNIKGFKMRLLKPETDRNGRELPKYKNTIGLDKKGSFFGVSGGKLQGVGKERDITIVEGELDALHAQAVGLPYVVAATGGKLFPEALKELKDKGAEKITLLFDSDEIGSAAAKESTKKILSALEEIRAAHLVGYVAQLPAYNGEKVDVDTFLKTHTKEDLLYILDGAQTEASFRFDVITEEHGYAMGATGEITDKQRDAYLKDLFLLLTSDYITPTDRGQIVRKVEELSDGDITKEEIESQAAKIQAEQDRAKQNIEVRSLLRDASTRMDAGEDTERVLSELKEKASKLSTISRETEYRKYMEEDIDSLFEEYKQTTTGIETNIELLTDKDTYKVLFPSGALTIIAAPSNHGKSRVLQSLSLNTATGEGEGLVLYITYEENLRNVNRQLLNAFADIELTMETAKHGNEQTIEEYLSNGSTKYIKGAALSSFKEKVEEYKELRRTRLRLIKPEDNQIETLLGLLRYATSQKGTKVRAIFIDYVQELYIGDTRKITARTDELKLIMMGLDNFAHETHLPIILAAQMKAETDSPLTMTKEDIADSIQIARKASEILLLWSSKEKPVRDVDGKKMERVQRELPELNIGARGRIYILLAKSRFIPTGASAVLSINGNTGRVKENGAKEEGKTPREALPFENMPEDF